MCTWEIIRKCCTWTAPLPLPPSPVSPPLPLPLDIKSDQPGCQCSDILLAAWAAGSSAPLPPPPNISSSSSSSSSLSSSSSVGSGVGSSLYWSQTNQSKWSLSIYASNLFSVFCTFFFPLKLLFVIHVLSLLLQGFFLRCGSFFLQKLNLFLTHPPT